MDSVKNITQRTIRVAVCAFVAVGLLFGAAVPAVAATSDQPVRPNSVVSSTADRSDVAVRSGDRPAAHRLVRRQRRQDEEFLKLINAARAHPELYPPHGNAENAATTACVNPLQFSRALRNTARAHNRYLASQPIDWVDIFPNMHTGPEGKPVTEPGEPMDLAGYHSYRTENVATGFPTTEAALKAWMQDDERSGWGHRNAILNCTIQEGGASQLHGVGPSNHYYTLDAGNR